MQYLEKEILYKLYIEDNLTKKEIVEKLQCSFFKVDQSIRYYGFKKSREQISEISKRIWNAKTEEEKLLHAQKSREWWKKLTKEEQNQFMKNLIVNKTDLEKEQINEKRKQAWKNKSTEEWRDFKQKISSKSKQTWEGYSETRKAEIIEKRKNTFANMDIDRKKELYKNNGIKSKQTWEGKSEQEKQAIIQKIKTTQNNKSDEEKQAIKEKMKVARQNVSEEEKLLRKQHRQEVWAKRTEEQKQITELKKQANLLEKYGVTNVAQLDSVREKHSKSWNNKSEEEKQRIRNSIRTSCIQAWVEKPQEEIDGYIQKIFDTKAKNKTWTVSKPENRMYKLLCQMFGKENIKRQYKTEFYPHHCDFYIIPLDLYIEANFHWTHGGHPFNPNDKDDIKRLEHLQEKAKTSEFYKVAIQIWTMRDTIKLQDAKKNSLNYKFFYNFNEFISWLDTMIYGEARFKI